MMSAHFPLSARTNSANCSGVIGRASTPRFAMRRATSACASAREARSFSRWMISREVPARAQAQPRGRLEPRQARLRERGNFERGVDSFQLGNRDRAQAAVADVLESGAGVDE